jgi:queuine/archaeosine tRNA-ribosyltransferase
MSFYQTLMAEARQAILSGTFLRFKRAFLSEYLGEKEREN